MKSTAENEFFNQIGWGILWIRKYSIYSMHQTNCYTTVKFQMIRYKGTVHRVRQNGSAAAWLEHTVNKSWKENWIKYIYKVVWPGKVSKRGVSMYSRQYTLKWYKMLLGEEWGMEERPRKYWINRKTCKWLIALVICKHVICICNM